MAGRWAKVAANFHTHPKVVAAGRLGREVFFWAICRNAEGDCDGYIHRGYFGPNYLSQMLGMSIEEASAGLDACYSAGLLSVDDTHVSINGWDPTEWGNPKSTPRVQALRERKSKTAKHETRGNVTSVSCNGETDETRETQIRGEERRLEEKREEKATAPTAVAGLPPAQVVLSIPEPKKPRARRQSGGAPNPDHQRFVDLFTSLYRERHGEDPSWPPKNHGIVKRLLKRHGFDKCAERATGLMRSPPRWVTGGIDVGLLESQWDKLAAGPARPETGHYKHTGEETYAGGKVGI